MRAIEEAWLSQKSGEHFCEGCPGQESPYPLAFGNTDANIMLVGMEPAYNVVDDNIADDMEWEEAETIIVSDRKESMNPLWQHMVNVTVAAGLSDPTELYFTNLAKCAAGSFGERVAHCAEYFKQEIIGVDPELVLLHGGKVINEVFDIFNLSRPSSVGSVHGTVFETSHYKLMPLYHWGYAHRQGNVMEYNQTVARKVAGAL